MPTWRPSSSPPRHAAGGHPRAREPRTEAEATANAEATEAPRALTEIEADIAEANADLDALYAELMPEAEAAIERFNAGEDIDALIAELSDDNMPETGYAVSETAEASRRPGIPPSPRARSPWRKWAAFPPRCAACTAST